MNKEKLVAYGYVGRWNDGELGWYVPCFMDHRDNEKKPAKPYIHEGSGQSIEAELCKITIEIVKKSPRRLKRIIRRA